MLRSTDRILTTHTGSLPRPAELERAMLDTLEGNQPEPERLDALIREGTLETVRRQVESGVDVVNDGEVGKSSYATYVQERLEGFGGESGPMIISDLMEYPETAATLTADPGFSHMGRPACVAPLRRRESAGVDRDIALFKECLQGAQVEEAFMSAVSPATIAMFHENQHYPDHQSYLYALADVMKPEYQAIIDAGLVLQIDCPDLGCGHVMFPDASLEEVKRNLAIHMEVLNHVVQDLPPDRMRMHVCWGNYEGPHHRDIDLREIIGLVLSARPQGLSLEGANPRHEHEWEVFEDVKLPDGKVLIPGVIDSTNNYIEHPALVAQRIVRYANVVGRENVIAGSDCGFATLVGMRMTSPSVAWAKLQTLAEGARLASRQLW